MGFPTIQRAYLAQGQATPEATINEAIDDLIRATHGLYTKAISGDVDASVASSSSSSEYRQFLRATVVKFTGAVAGSPSNGTYLLPSGVEKFFVFHNATSSHFRVKVPGSTGVLVNAGIIARLALIGTDVVSLDAPDIMNYAAAVGSPAIDQANDYLLFYDAGLGLKRIAPSNLPSAGPGSPTPATRFTFRGAMVRKNASQNILSGNSATVTWGTEVYDTDGFYGGGGSPSPDTHLFVPNGITRVRVQAGFQVGGTSVSAEYQIRKNGAASVDYVGGGRLVQAVQAGGVAHAQVATAWIPVSAGDFFHVFCINRGSGTITLGAGTAFQFFAIEAWPDS